MKIYYGLLLLALSNAVFAADEPKNSNFENATITFTEDGIIIEGDVIIVGEHGISISGRAVANPNTAAVARSRLSVDNATRVLARLQMTQMAEFPETARRGPIPASAPQQPIERAAASATLAPKEETNEARADRLADEFYALHATPPAISHSSSASLTPASKSDDAQPN